MELGGALTKWKDVADVKSKRNIELQEELTKLKREVAEDKKIALIRIRDLLRQFTGAEE